ncbi:argininosuccinate synthase [Fluviispira multicolorata]|uniref:Argininosuccinate synthase n=1 Tax=Fluviispira multicolorata TaxID=2654512 RepID=A0A833N6B4_9BACT|nr:argininosuccinate synthase [Fluviispira multicolorata]KAB8033205.1 argininosuccinate synthase [Fluviispira multicolorata]
MTDYVKVASYEGRKGEIRKVVLLYSGGLDTSVMLKWIQEQYNAEVIALTIDIGQQADNLEEIKDKALRLGAKKAYVIDAKKEFAYHYLAKGIKANARYQGDYHLATPLGRPLLAKIAVDIAREENCDCIAHGCTGKGNDQVRIEGTVLTLAPEMKIIAPVREWGMGRDEELEYARLHNIPVKQTKDSPYSYDDNMWGVSAEGGEIENPALIPNLPAILQVCKIVEDTPHTPELLKIGFLRGIPVQLNGEDMNLPSIIFELNKLGALHGVGVTHHLEDRVVGLKVRGVYESPAAHTIIRAHETLEKFVCTRLENEFKMIVDQKWGYLCYGALWHEPLMDDLNAFIERINEKVTGIVTVKLFKGRADVVAVETPNSIFDEKLATFMKSNAFNQNASAGFTEIYTMQMRLSQEKERYALVSVGGDQNKEKFAPAISELYSQGFVLFATQGTHNYLNKLGVKSVLVHKANQENHKPNLIDLLKQNRFDLVVNVASPTNTISEEIDGKSIRSWSVKNGVQLITDYEVLKVTVERMNKSMKSGVSKNQESTKKPALL